MPAVQRSEFALALNQVANERGVDVSVVLDTVKNAILAAYRKDHPGIEIEEFSTTLNSNTGEARILHKEEDVTPPGFGRIAAQTAKQVILQKIREKEKEAIVSDYRGRVGTIVNGMVLKFLGPNIVVDIGKAEGIMPASEQIGSEKYHLNQRLTLYIVEIREGLKGEEIIVSRSNPGLLEGLFKREVPEIAQGSVVIKTISREAGNRSKVAVYSTQSGIDPVGSCVGQKGVRVQAIIAEFSGIEKIDIIQWQEDPKSFVAQALSPAKNVKVEVNEEEKTAYVTVPQDELSLAIGRDGQNVRLASKLTGYRIEIKGDEKPEDIVQDLEESKTSSADSSVEPKKEVKAEKKTARKKKVAVKEEADKEVDSTSTTEDSESTSVKDSSEQKVKVIEEEKEKVSEKSEAQNTKSETSTNE